MTNVQSKLAPVSTTCKQYVHPWTESCWTSTAGLLLQAAQHSSRIYTAVYLLSLAMRGRIPSKEELKRTLSGILQSSAFLTVNSFGYVMFTCLLRNLLGEFHFLTMAYIPSFIASFFAILVERPTRRTLLTLYVSNVATETVWRMLAAREWVRPIWHGKTLIFGVSISILLYFYRLGLRDELKDSLFDILRFVVGRDEEYFVENPEQLSTIARENEEENLVNNEIFGVEGPVVEGQQQPVTPRHISRRTNNYSTISRILRMYINFIKYLKSRKSHPTCPHNNSCIYYTLRGGLKLFSVGLGLQVTLKLALQLKKILQLKMQFRKTIFNLDTLKLAICLGGFSFLYKSMSCLLRHLTNMDHPVFAIPAGLFASCAFSQYPDTTVALYVMWKMLQLSYTLGIQKSLLPRVPGFNILLYCASTALLFHAALIEPLNLRPSYWKFLHGISGGRVGVMDRNAIDVWGLETSKALKQIKVLTNTDNQPVKFAIR